MIPQGPAGRRYVVGQLGARMNYAVPRFLHEAGYLEKFHTDFYSGSSVGQVLRAVPPAWRPAGVRRLLGRSSPLPHHLVQSYPLFGLSYYLRNVSAADAEAASQTHLWGGRAFGTRVVQHGFGKAGAVYAFNTAALEILTAARRLGLFTVLEQTIVPRAIEEELMRGEHARYPDWEPPLRTGTATEAIMRRESEEWNLADLIVCGSQFVRDGIARCGGSAERCAVVPYGVDSGVRPQRAARARGPLLRVLTVGHVSLRKGAPYVLAVAKALQGIAEFRWVGPILVRDAAAADLAGHVALTGAVPRSDVNGHYDWADVFFLPSVCEGSATVTYEALSSGLPVVTTPGAGSPVRDGVDGLVVADRDSDAMSRKLRQLHQDRSLLSQLAAAASSGADALTLAAYKKRLLPLLQAAG